MPSEVCKCVVWSTKQCLNYRDAFECLQMFPVEPMSGLALVPYLLVVWELHVGRLDRLQIVRSERTYGKLMKSWKVWELWLFKVDPSIASDSLLLFFLKPQPFGFRIPNIPGSLSQVSPSMWHWCSLGFHPWPTSWLPPHVLPAWSHSHSWL